MPGRCGSQAGSRVGHSTDSPNRYNLVLTAIVVATAAAVKLTSPQSPTSSTVAGTKYKGVLPAHQVWMESLLGHTTAAWWGVRVCLGQGGRQSTVVLVPLSGETHRVTAQHCGAEDRACA